MPEDLEKDINNMINYLNDPNDNHSCVDCYQMEVLTSLNWCIRENLMSMESIQLLRKYYVSGGVFKENE